jgi:hypothetical protein
MRKILLTIIVLLISNAINAQFSNTGFENWVTVNSYENPVNWITSNDIYKSIDASLGTTTPTSVFKVTGNSGNYAIEMETVPFIFFGSTNNYPGFAFAYTPKGFAYSQRPANLTGYYKFVQGANFPAIDSASIVVSFSKWNGTSRDSIGGAVLWIKVNAPSFTSFSLPINYLNGTIPDSAEVGMFSSGINEPFTNIKPRPYSGSVLTVDDLSFSSATGIKNSLLNKTISLYPNPALDEINIKNIPAEASTIDIRDFIGKKVQLLEVSSDFMNLKTENLSSGMYFYTISNVNGEVLYTDKFSILK